MKDAFIPLLRRIHGFLMASGSGDSPAVVALKNDNVHAYTPEWAGAETTPVVFADDGGDDFDPGAEEREESAPDPFIGGLKALRDRIKQLFVHHFGLHSDKIQWIPGNAKDKHYLYITHSGQTLIATMTAWIEEDVNDVNETGFGIDCYYEDDNYIRSVLDGTRIANEIVHHYMFCNLESEWEGTCTFFDRTHKEKYDITCNGEQSVGDTLCGWMCSNYMPETPDSADRAELVPWPQP